MEELTVPYLTMEASSFQLQVRSPASDGAGTVGCLRSVPESGDHLATSFSITSTSGVTRDKAREDWSKTIDPDSGAEAGDHCPGS